MNLLFAVPLDSDDIAIEADGGARHHVLMIVRIVKHQDAHTMAGHLNVERGRTAHPLQSTVNERERDVDGFLQVDKGEDHGSLEVIIGDMDLIELTLHHRDGGGRRRGDGGRLG